jgi:hypothetical protein
MKMKNLLLTLILVTAGFGLCAQSNDCKCSDEVQDIRLDNKLTCIVLPPAVVQTPDDGLYGQWRFGKIILNNGEVISGVIIHYDGLNDQLIIDSKNPAIKLAVEKYTIQGFEVGTLHSDPVYRFRRIKVNRNYSGDHQDVFLQELNPGKNTLYVYRKLSEDHQLNRVVRNYIYFITREGGSMISFTKPSRKTILKLFPENAALLRIRLRKIHNRVRNEEQLINAINVLNSL